MKTPLEPGTPVLLRFQSHFNRSAVQTVTGTVKDPDDVRRASGDLGDTVIEGETSGLFLVSWEGGVDKYDGDEWNGYGGDARMWALDPVDPTPNLDADEINDGDKRAVDEALDNEHNVDTSIAYEGGWDGSDDGDN